jgi:hypothetical protein
MDDFEVLEKELREMPEWDRVWAVREFHGSVKVFRVNADHLLEYLAKSQAPEVARELFLLQNRDEVAGFQQELMRLLHNFVAAAYTLVDHARLFFCERYKPLNLFPDYESEVATRFASTPMARFVQDLRNLVLHTRLPSVTSRMKWTREHGVTEHEQFWQKKDLLRFSRWKPESKAFLACAADEINIGQVVREYTGSVKAFYEWVFERLKEIHAQDQEAVEQKQAAIQKAVDDWAAR